MFLWLIVVSPTSGYLNVPTSPSTSTGIQDQGMIVLSEPCQLGASDNYVMSTGPQAGRDEDKLLLLTDPTQPAEVSPKHQLHVFITYFI